MHSPGISIDDDAISSVDINNMIGYLSVGNQGSADDVTVEWEDKDEQDECAMWERLKSDALHNIDEREWDSGVRLVQATREVIDGQLHVTLPAEYARDYFTELYNGSSAFDALEKYVDWEAVASDMLQDMVHVTTQDTHGAIVSFYARG